VLGVSGGLVAVVGPGVRRSTYRVVQFVFDARFLVAVRVELGDRGYRLGAGQDTLERGQTTLGAGQATLGEGQTTQRDGQATVGRGQTSLGAGQTVLGGRR